MLRDANPGGHAAQGVVAPPLLVTPALPLEIDTPALVVDLDIMDRNIERMQGDMSERGIALRPHVKTHSSTYVGGRQLAAGAAGLTVGTMAMAEALADAGFEDVFLAFPIWAGGPKAERVRSLNERCRLIVAVDSLEGLEALATAVDRSERPLRVSIEVDSGEHRTGVRAPADAVDIGQQARRLGVEVAGIFTHGGHSYLGVGAVAPAADDEVACLSATVRAMESAGFRGLVVSAGSTPTVSRSARAPVTEERPGTYVFGDRQQLVLGGCDPDGLALWVVSTVVSVGAGWFVLDAGAKILAKDRPDWLEGHGTIPAYPRATIEHLYDFHAVVTVTSGDPVPRVGEVLAVLPNHVCPVVNLVGAMTGVRAGAQEMTIEIDARGH